MRKRALIIANSRYSDEHFTDLPAAAADAAALDAVLADRAIGGFDVTALVDASQRQAMRALEGFFAEAGPGDMLFLHLSVHGWKDRHNRLYFIMSDTERGYPGSTAIAAETISEWMSRSRSKRIVVTLDCCYSGAFVVGGARRSSKIPEVDVAEPLSGNGRAVLTASTSLQYSHEDEQDVRFSWSHTRPSVFTRAMVDGLRDGSADRDGDGQVSVHDLYHHIDERVRAEVSGQTPTLSVDNIQGLIFIARNPNRAEDDGFDRMRDAAGDSRAWMRVGSLFEIERQLGSVHRHKREAATEALLTLIADRDLEVARRARELWHDRGLGPIPDLRRPRSYAAPHPALAGTFAVGIDFGTTNSSIAYFDGDDVQVIPNREGYRSTPSVVAIADDGTLLVGGRAERQMLANPDATVRSAKLKLGTDWSIERFGVRLTAERAAELILAELRADAEAHLGRAVDNAVITVPSNFGRAQRLALLEAAANAGLTVFRLLNEPTAAAMTLKGARADEGARSLLIFDMGGGTLDVTVAELEEYGVLQVKTSRGDNRLGGDDWDRWLIEHFVESIRRRHGVVIDRTAEVEQRLWVAAERAKVELSSARTSRVLLPHLAATPHGPLHFDYEITRDEFEQGTKDLLERCAGPIRLALADAYPHERWGIDEVILTGGATRMPAIERIVRQASGCERVYRGLIPEGIVAGATLEAAMLTGAYKDTLLLDVIPAAIRVRLEDGTYSTLLDQDATLPTVRSEVFTIASADQTTAVVLFVERFAAEGSEKPLAVLELKGLTAAPGSGPRIELTANVDANNLVELTAQQVGTDNRVGVVVDRRSIEEAGQRMRRPDWPKPGTGLARYRDEAETSG